MAVKIRLARGGAKKKPYYRVVVANATAPRDGDFLEKVGTYNPLLPKGEGNRVTLKADRIVYWLSQGATPTDTVAKFIEASGIKLPEFVASKMAVKLKSRKHKAKKKEVPAEAVAPAPVAVAPAAPAPAAEAPAPAVEEVTAAEAPAPAEEAAAPAVEEVAEAPAPAEEAAAPESPAEPEAK